MPLKSQREKLKKDFEDVMERFKEMEQADDDIIALQEQVNSVLDIIEQLGESFEQLKVGFSDDMAERVTGLESFQRQLDSKLKESDTLSKRELGYIKQRFTKLDKRLSEKASARQIDRIREESEQIQLQDNVSFERLSKAIEALREQIPAPTKIVGGKNISVRKQGNTYRVSFTGSLERPNIILGGGGGNGKVKTTASDQADFLGNKVVEGTNIGISILANGTLQISATGSASGEANDGQNVGASGLGVYAGKSSETLLFRKFYSTDNRVTLTQGSSMINVGLTNIPDTFVGSGGASVVYQDGLTVEIYATPGGGSSVYTSADFDTDFASKSTDDLSEGNSNFYHVQDRLVGTGTVQVTHSGVTTTINGVSTQHGLGDHSGDSDDVTEGSSNFYYTEPRATASIINAIGSTIQAWDTHLDNLAGLAPGAEGRMITSNGLGNWQVSSTSAVRAYLNVGNGAEANMVDSVNGLTGAVVLNTNNIDQGTSNFY
jgi:hypothetical protein